MKVLFLTSILFASLLAQAAPKVIELENGSIDPKVLEQETHQDLSFRSRTGEVIAGAIIGGIVGAISADIWDREYRRGVPPGHYDDRYYRPERPGRPGYPPGRGDLVTCFAQNRRGEVFRASAYWARAAQDRALQKCYDYSRHCRPLGCRR